MPTTTGNDETLDAYRALEDRIRASDRDGLRDRWEFGRALLAELGSRERLPNGRRDEIAKAVAIGRAEVNNRMQFAKEYPTEERLTHAVSQFVSWHEIVRRGLGDRGSAPTPASAKEDRFDAFRVPRPLWKRLRKVTRAAFAAGAAFGDNQPGTHGVGALLAFVEGEGHAAWEAWLASRPAQRGAA